jgi:hypothetical protein
VNSAASLTAGLPVGRRFWRAWIVAAYAVPAAAIWLLLGLCLTVAPLGGAALIAAAAYACCYGVPEAIGSPGLKVPGRQWQVPQTLLIGVPARRRILLWGALLGPGLATRNPYAGFWLLPIAVAAMNGPVAGLALGALIGAAHGTARALALLRDVRVEWPVLAGDPAGQLELLLKSAYWRRLDGYVLLAAAVAAAVAAARHFT